MHIDDPTATYRGYRRQALYALSRLFDNSLSINAVIQPEGNEDLAIYDHSDTLIEIVQVKDYTTNLVASSFKPSFYQRIAPYCALTSQTVVRIVSYGPIGPDLRSATTGKSDAVRRVVQTITKKQKKEHKQPDGSKKTTTIQGLPEPEAKNIINRLTLTKVDESDLTNAVIKALQATITGIDARHAFELLMWWLITSSETQLKIDRALAIEKVNRIGKFLAQRAAHHDEWHTFIIPIGPSESYPTELSTLVNEFFLGGRVRFDHIDANIDIPRDRFLKEIHSAFSTNNVVVIHSASGQGKTSLAYRYAKEFSPADFRFEISPAENIRHARRLAQALIGHVEAIEVPTLVYIDVKPGDDNWIELVQQLSSVSGIRVLVTIREEDWSRSRAARADFSFAEIILYFDQDEAKLIYDRLTTDNSNTKYLDFDEAWHQFGAQKALFEFVYYLTQAESLATRLEAQITSLQDAVIQGERSKGEIELLRLVAVASAYEARVDLKSLVNYCSLEAPKRTLEHFNNEYLIRVSDDGQYIEGFHSIRSAIITQQLIDPILNSWADTACQCIPLIVEDDLENFLLCAFSRHVDSASSLLDFLNNFHPKSWVGIRGVMTSMMWNGLRTYIEENWNLLEDIYEKHNNAWYIILDWDLAQAYGKNGFSVLENLKHLSSPYAEAAEFAQAARQNQTDKDSIFLNLRYWLTQVSETPNMPTTIGGVAAMAEVLFWVGHLAIPTPLCKSLTDNILDLAIDILPIQLLGEFILGIRTCQPNLYEQWCSERRELLTSHLQHEAATLALVENEQALVAHYIVDIDQKNSDPHLHNNPINSIDTLSMDALYESTMERIELLSQVFTGKEQYGAIGYGHRTSLVELTVDEAERPGASAEYLLPPWLPRFNALARGLVQYYFRPENWADYFSNIQTIRRDVLSALSDLRQSTTSFSRTQKHRKKFSLKRPTQWDECKKTLNRPILLPKVAVDEWGFVAESIKQDENVRKRRLRYPSLNRLSPIQTALNEYIRTVDNFMSQALNGLALLPPLHAAEGPEIKANILAQAADLGISEHTIHLSVVNGVDACLAVHQLSNAIYDVFGRANFPSISDSMMSREYQKFLSTITAWCTFAYPPSTIHRQQSTKKSHRQKQKKTITKKSTPAQATNFGELLDPTRNRLRNTLRGLRRYGIKASIHSETVPWDNKSALWISYNTDHPLASLRGAEIIWYELISAFDPDRDKIVRIKAIDLLWSKIILVPIVAGKSLEGLVYPNFQGVTNMQVPDLEQHPWHLFPETVPQDIWNQLRLEQWEADLSWSIFDQFTTAYNLLLQHIDHLADFKRLPSELETLGVSMLQSYIDNKMIRIQPLFQEARDSHTSILDLIHAVETSLLSQRPNLIDCLKNLVEISDSLLPAPACDHSEEIVLQLSLNQLDDWRSQLRDGLPTLGIARYLWIADTLGFGEYNDVSEFLDTQLDSLTS